MDNIITQLKVVSVSLKPNPIGTGEEYTISVDVQEKKYILVAEPELEFAFSNESLTQDLIIMGDLVYKEVT